MPHNSPPVGPTGIDGSVRQKEPRGCPWVSFGMGSRSYSTRRPKAPTHVAKRGSWSQAEHSEVIGKDVKGKFFEESTDICRVHRLRLHP